MAVGDIFNRNVSNLAGVFTSDSAKLTMIAGLGVLVQQLQCQYAQRISRIYEVGANGPGGASNIYYVGGRTEGRMNLNRVVGPTGSVKAMYVTYGDVCKASKQHIDFTINDSSCGANNVKDKYIMSNAVLTTVGISVSSQDMIISEALGFEYSSLRVE